MAKFRKPKHAPEADLAAETVLTTLTEEPKPTEVGKDITYLFGSAVELGKGQTDVLRVGLGAVVTVTLFDKQNRIVLAKSFMIPSATETAIKRAEVSAINSMRDSLWLMNHPTEFFQAAHTQWATADVEAERRFQIDMGYTPDHDDKHGAGHIQSEIIRRLESVEDRRGSDMGLTSAYARKTFVEVAAMAVAGIEYFDREADRG